MYVLNVLGSRVNSSRALDNSSSACFRFENKPRFLAWARLFTPQTELSWAVIEPSFELLGSFAALVAWT